MNIPTFGETCVDTIYTNNTGPDDSVVWTVCPICDKVTKSMFWNLPEYNSVCKQCFDKPDFSGFEFGQLTVIEPIGSGSEWLVVCLCGNAKIIKRNKLGKSLSCGCGQGNYKSGTDRYNYNSELTNLEKDMMRISPEYKVWRDSVRERDEYQCQCCGVTPTRKKGAVVKVVAHHLWSFSDNTEIRFDINNGVTLCKLCHYDFHVRFMGGWQVPCTEEDYYDWLDSLT